MKFVVSVFLICICGCLSANIRPKPILRGPTPIQGQKIRPKITGGQEAEPHSIPNQVAIILLGNFCAGSLISPRYVLTGALCGELDDQPTVILGAHRITAEEPDRVIITASRTIVHPKWDQDKFINDIALVELSQDAPINDIIKPISVASPDIGSLAGTIAKVSGWGVTYDGDSSINSNLQYVENKILSKEECQEIFGDIPVQDTYICFDGSDGKAPCVGDYGDPLSINGKDGSSIQVGIMSFAISARCQIGLPSAFTRVSEYVDWIEENSDVKIRRV